MSLINYIAYNTIIRTVIKIIPKFQYKGLSHFIFFDCLLEITYIMNKYTGPLDIKESI